LYTRISVMTALIENPRMCLPKILTCEQRSVYRLACSGGGSAEAVGGGVVVIA
jgi:hypothetical protein